MPTFNAVCHADNCPVKDRVIEVVVVGIGKPLPACESCGGVLVKTFAPTDKDKAFFAERAKHHHKVKDPFLKPNTVLRRAFDPKSTPSDMVDDMRRGDIYL